MVVVEEAVVEAVVVAKAGEAVVERVVRHLRPPSRYSSLFLS